MARATVCRWIMLLDRAVGRSWDERKWFVTSKLRLRAALTGVPNTPMAFEADIARSCRVACETGKSPPLYIARLCCVVAVLRRGSRVCKRVSRSPFFSPLSGVPTRSPCDDATTAAGRGTCTVYHPPRGAPVWCTRCAGCRSGLTCPRRFPSHHDPQNEGRRRPHEPRRSAPRHSRRLISVLLAHPRLQRAPVRH